MKLFNQHTATSPLVFHAPGNDHFRTRWFKMVENVLLHTKEHGIVFPELEQLSIITFLHGNIADVLCQQLQLAGIPFTNLADHYKHDGVWLNTHKIMYTCQYLQEIHTPYVMSLDATDVLLSEDMTGLLDRFLNLDCDVLFGASKGKHPIDMDDIEDPNSEWPYLNAGTMMGKREKALEFYQACALEAEKSTDKDVKNEQRVIKKVRRDFANVKSDTGCEIFQTSGRCLYDYQHGLVTVRPIMVQEQALPVVCKVVDGNQNKRGKAYLQVDTHEMARVVFENNQVVEGNELQDLMESGVYTFKS